MSDLWSFSVLQKIKDRDLRSQFYWSYTTLTQPARMELCYPLTSSDAHCTSHSFYLSLCCSSSNRPTQAVTWAQSMSITGWRVSIGPEMASQVQCVSLMSRLGNRGVRVSVFFLQKLRFSALCWPNQQKFGTLLTWPKVISPPKYLPNLSTDGQENATFSPNPASKIPPLLMTHEPRVN